MTCAITAELTWALRVLVMCCAGARKEHHAAKNARYLQRRYAELRIATVANQLMCVLDAVTLRVLVLFDALRIYCSTT